MISVIIVAYHRKEFIKRAIESVINQSLHRTLYEIIVIKNYKDAEIDEFINKNCDKNIYSEYKSLGMKLKEAINASKYDIISFLEDDDLFYFEKLNVVRQEFSRNSKLEYFHNACKIVEADGKFLRYGGFGPDFNLSSISIRKNYFDKSLILDSSSGIDSFVYVACLDSGGEILLDERPLTVYMLHESSSVFKGSFDEVINHYCEDAGNFLTNIKILEKLVKTKKVKEILANMSVKFRLNLNIYSSISKKKNIDQISLRELLGFLLTSDEVSLSFKSKAIKIFEYYSPLPIKLVIERRRFKLGQRPT